MDADLIEAMRQIRIPPPSDGFNYSIKPATVNRVHGNLWMGGWPPPGYRIGRHFDCLVLCAEEYQVPACFSHIQVAQAKLNDDGSPMRREEAFRATRAAIKVIGWLKQDLRVLVTCFAGRNRSGLVCALALCRGPARMNSAQAIRTIRNARGEGALSNRYFLKYLTDLDRMRSGT